MHTKWSVLLFKLSGVWQLPSVQMHRSTVCYFKHGIVWHNQCIYPKHTIASERADDRYDASASLTVIAQFGLAAPCVQYAKLSYWEHHPACSLVPQCATTAGSSRLQAKFLDLISKLLQTLPFNLAEGIIRAAAEPQVYAADTVTLYYSSVTACHASRSAVPSRAPRD